MRIQPVCLTAALVLAFASGGAFAQAGARTGASTGAVTSPTFSGSTPDSNRVQGGSGGGVSAVQAPVVSRAGQDNTLQADPTLTRPGSFEPGGAFGPANVAPVATDTGVPGNAVMVPGSSTQTGTQQNVFVQPQAQPPGVTVLSTPILDQAVREGRAKEARRRARGDEPRVYGIAPRTDRDLTWQMPDDPIIRY